jgi:hypothetical protein
VLEAVVAAAQADEVAGVGGSVGVAQDVVDVFEAGRASAAGESAGDVAGADEAGHGR